MPQMAFMIVAAVASAVQKISEAQAQAASYENQAKAMDANARVAAMNASIADSEGRLEAAGTAENWYKQLGRQRAALAQGGVLESATGLLVREEAERHAQEDEFAVQHRTDINRMGYEFQAADLRSNANVARGNASQAKLGGWLGGISSFAGGMSGAYGQYKQYGWS